MISAETTIGQLYRRGLMSTQARYACRLGKIKTLSQLLSIKRNYLQRVMQCDKKTLVELDEMREYYSHYLQEQHTDIEENPVIIIEETELKEAQKKIELLAPNSVVHLKGWIAWKFNELSVRAKNAFPQLNQLLPVIEAVYSTEKFNAQDAKNIGKKTSGEIQSFLSEVKAHFEDITKDIDPNVDIPEHNEYDRMVAQLGELYPFMLTRECEVVAKHISSYGIVPILYIAKLYILRSEDSRINIFRDYYGFNSEGRRYSLSETGERNNLSRERIRQLVSKKISLPKSLEDEIHHYLKPLLEDLIPFDSLFWNKVQRDNMLEEPYSHTALLACSVADTHTIIQIEDNDKEYLVDKELIENVKIRNVLNSIVRVIALRRTTVERLDILNFIKDENHVYHKDVSHLCSIYANYLRKNYDVDIEDNRYVMLQPNAMDISIAIEDILEQSGKPMSLEGIKQAFNTLYPSNSIDNVAKLKPYIFRNPHIKPKGKTGTYVLESWENHFTGTLTSYLVHILQTFNEPIPLDDLVDFALDEFPKSNKKSIYSLIIGDKDERFIVYENDYIGVTGKPISEIEFKERKIIKRQNFNSRFEELKQFVSTLKRLPILTGSEEEQSLARWISNVLKSNIETTEDQMCSLEKFLEENKTLPQNGTEYNFKQMCDEIKVMVAKTFALPTASDNIREYSWLRKNINKYSTYEDNRKSYFEDLLSYLKDYGFYI